MTGSIEAMMLVPRYVRKLPETQDAATSFEEPRDLREFHDLKAWALLGEPGAGKTEAFKSEAGATADAICLRVAEFIDVEPEGEWQGKTLFLDGLDEVRGSGVGDSILLKVRRQLKRLGSPPFRIACRAADWYGSSDREELKQVSPSGQVDVLLLEPLSRDDIRAILRDNHGHGDQDSFIASAEERGVLALLENPQTLELLVKAIRDDQWPSTRDDTYRLACETLAEESNRRRRNRGRHQPVTVERVLNAAGHLSATLLLSDKTGIALDSERANERFPELAAFDPLDLEAATVAIGSKLFRPDSEERLVPSHRSIAEHLGARWIARRIDAEGLPAKRVLNLLLGRDDRAVAGLRGLYGWLALHCRALRSFLINADPLTVVVYGDVKPMSSADKRQLLQSLSRETEQCAVFRRDEHAAQRLGALSSVELQDEFLAILKSNRRDRASQALADCVCDILVSGEPQFKIAPSLLAVIRDDSRWPAVRKRALDAWIKLKPEPSGALLLLDELAANQVMDSDDDLAGRLLDHLYPAHLPPQALLTHLHPPKASNLLGAYVRFWTHDLPECAPDDQLPALLDGLVQRPQFHSYDLYEHRFDRTFDVLLLRGLATHGDRVAEERLLLWLGIGFDEYGHSRREQAERQAIAQWLSARPERYKALLALCFQRCEGRKHLRHCITTQTSRLHDAEPPDDIGLWYLQQASEAVGDEMAEIHLREAVNALVWNKGASGLSLEKLDSWAASAPKRRLWLAPLLVSEVQEWRVEQTIEAIARQQKQAGTRAGRIAWLAPQLNAVRTGKARVDLMHQLAGVREHRFIDVHGDTPAKRFDSFSDNGRDVFDAAEVGFRLCVERQDLPTVDEIVDLSLKKKEHYIRLPCLIGMELRWGDGPSGIDSLSEATLRRMVAFRLTYGADNAPAWFSHLVGQRPSLVAEVLIVYASTALAAGQDYVDSIYPLERDPQYKEVAIIAVPRLLQMFPARARSQQLRYLECLLKAALRSMPKELKAQCGRKTAMKGMDSAQKVYWHAAAALLNGPSCEAELWRYIGKSQGRASHLSAFLSDDFGEMNEDYSLSAGTIGRLVELILPRAEIEWAAAEGFVTKPMRRGEHVRRLVAHLGAMATPEAEQEINRLLGLPSLEKLALELQSARHQLRLRQRESEFRFLPLRQVVQVLANKAPASAADLAALALHHLDDIARELRQDNDDGVKAFWNIEDRKPISQRDENHCRDALLTRLRPRLNRVGVDSQPEPDYANDKRADLRLSYRTDFELPIEIKRDSNTSLWSAPSKQLVAQYAPNAAGHAIYLVLWFGGERMPRATDSGTKPRTPDELRVRLEAQLDPIERARIHVRVIDVSWPR